MYIPNIVYLKETMITTAVTHVTIYSFPFFSFHINVNICPPKKSFVAEISLWSLFRLVLHAF